MPITQKPTTVDQAFFQPLNGLTDASPHARTCPDFPMRTASTWASSACSKPQPADAASCKNTACASRTRRAIPITSPPSRAHGGAKMAVGHFYSLNLRTHTLRHLAAAEGLHEHHR